MTDLDIEHLRLDDDVKATIRLLSSRYSITEHNSKGANGDLFLGSNRILKTDVAIKFYYWGGEAAYHAEPQTLTQIEAANVLRVLDAGYSGDNYAYFVTPRCKGGDLGDLLQAGPIPMQKAFSIFSEIVNGLSYLHAARFVHRDLKPENIYLEGNGTAVIGDFGSLGILPEGVTDIPASRHSLIFRPPESIDPGTYGFPGDIYQCGILLYLLLGGQLSYDAGEWLTNKEQSTAASIENETDRSIFVDGRIKVRIQKGRVLDLESLPPWVPSQLKRTLNRACNVRPQLRFPSSAALLTHLHKLRKAVPDWQILNGFPSLIGSTSFRLVPHRGQYIVEKRGQSGNWRRDNSFGEDTMSVLAEQLNNK